jgi:predicted esterase
MPEAVTRTIPKAIIILALGLFACAGPPEETHRCQDDLPPCTDSGTGPCQNVPAPATAGVEGRKLQTLFHDGYARTAPPTSKDAWLGRAGALREALWAASELPRTRPVPEATLVGSPRTVGNVVVHDLLIDGFEGMKIPAALYLPKDASGPVPAVLVNVGHDALGQNAGYIRTVCWRLAKNGVAALSMDWLGMGSRFGMDQRHVPMGLRSYLAGLLPTEPILGEPLLAFEYLSARPEVDPARVALAGQSGGGMVTMHLAAMEPRIAAAVVIDISTSNPYQFDTLRGWGDTDSFLPGFNAISSHGELLAMVAPRPLLVLTGDSDAIAPTAMAQSELDIAGAAYTLLDAGGNFDARGFPTMHCWCDSKIDAAVAFLGEALLGAPITDTSAPPGAALGKATEPPGLPRWKDLLPPRLAKPPAPAPTTGSAAEAWRARTQADLLALVSPESRPIADFMAAVKAPERGCSTALLWISDNGAAAPKAFARPGLWTLTLTPAGIDLGDESVDDRRYAAQLAIQLGRSILGYMTEDVLWAADGARALGAPRVVAVCDGPQASIACLAAAARVGALDGLAIAGLVTDFAPLLAIDPDDPFGDMPYGVLITPGLGRTVSPDMLLAQVAPRPLAVVGQTAADFPFTATIFERLEATAALGFVADEAGLTQAALAVLDRLAILE